MKKKIVLLALVLSIVFAVSQAQAAVVYMKYEGVLDQLVMSYSYNHGTAKETYTGQYQLRVKDTNEVIDAVCVDLLQTISSGMGYIPFEIQNITTNQQAAAAWILQQDYALALDRQAAQIAVWEILYDGFGGINLADGMFKLTSPTQVANAALWSQVGTIYSDAVGGYGSIDRNDFKIAFSDVTQDFAIVYKSTGGGDVPIPPTVYLLGAGLLGLVGLRRKFRK